MAQKRPQGKGTLIFGTHLFYLLAFSSFGRIPEGSQTNAGGSGDPPGPDFEKILRYLFASSVGILSGFVGF